MATKTIKTPKFVNGAPTDQVEEIQVEDYGNQEWGPKEKHRLVNTRQPRADAPFKATGMAKYTHDIKVPNMLHGRMVTSPYAHARILSIDTSVAEKIPGVKRVLVAATPAQGQEFAEVFYEGQAVAAVAATTPEIALDAARAVIVKYEKLPHVVTAEDAMKPGAPPAVRGGAGGGARGGFGGGRGGAGAGTQEQVDAALAQPGVEIVEAEYRTPILHHGCLETHSAVVDFNGGNSATSYVSTQGTGSIAGEARQELGVAVVGICQNMGGGFGSKGNGGGVPHMWANRLAKQIGQPVKMLYTRREEFLASGNGPGSIQKFKAGASKDGKIVGLAANQISLPGIGGTGVTAQPYQYSVAVVFRQAQTVTTHEDGSVPLRAPGHPQACFAMESLMDELAYKIGMDPIEFRKKNLPQGDTPRAILDRTTWSRQLDQVAKAIGWENRNKTPGKLAGPLVRGMGVGIGAWGGAGGQGCVVDVQINQDGTVTVSSGTQDLGTGTRTYMRAIVAEELGLNMEDVQEQIGDTRLPNSTGSGGSRTAAALSPAVKDAAYKARVAISEAAARMIGATADTVWFKERHVVGNGKALTWKQACATLPPTGISARGNFIAALASGNAHGASGAEVEVDLETGFVRVTKMAHSQNGGLIFNRLQAESQINGGMIQSISMALYEGRIMDAALGVMVNPAFNDYKIPGTMEMPEFFPIIDDGDTRNGVIGIAEPANIPGCGAVANAIYNACGVRIRSTPITPDKILMGLIALRKGA